MRAVLKTSGCWKGPFCLRVFAVLDDEDSNNITAGSIVTVTVTLTRKRMAVRNDWILFDQ